MRGRGAGGGARGAGGGSGEVVAPAAGLAGARLPGHGEEPPSPSLLCASLLFSMCFGAVAPLPQATSHAGVYGSNGRTPQSGEWPTEGRVRPRAPSPLRAGSDSLGAADP